MSLHFCSHCGAAALEFRIPEGDSKLRHVCRQCGRIHYLNPKSVVGTVPRWKDQVLLCRRAIEPRYGLWTLPAGFLEMGESIDEGARRETLEEAGATVILDRLYTVMTVPRVGQLHLMFLADLPCPEFCAGEESLETRLFDESDIPWEAIAFRTISRTLRCFFWDRRQIRQKTLGGFPLRVSSL
ncbi:MAG: NUDIX hydrolase [Burkholderiales bacterium]|jgi:ADP-ribose pyrophosphatase YjhB (NUDIX family)|nr:NUDIX hydrolase [Burkholderiales bacterium]